MSPATAALASSGELTYAELREECLRLQGCLSDLLDCTDRKCTLCGKCLAAITPFSDMRPPPPIADDDPVRLWKGRIGSVKGFAPMKKIALTIIFLLLASLAQAQTATVAYDYSASGATPSLVQGWIPTLFVNGTPFSLTHTCIAGVAPVLVTCTAPLPNISAALTTAGNQNFTVGLADAILGPGPQSLPLVRVKPNAPSAPRIAWQAAVGFASTS